MYENSNSARIEEQIQNAQLVKNLFKDRNMLDKK
jgi:hypothetical protein